MTQSRDNLTAVLGVAIGIGLTLLVSGFWMSLQAPWTGPSDMDSRLALAAKCLTGPAAMLLVGVVVVGLTRFGSDMQDPTRMEASTHGMRVNLRYLGNTHEQLTLYAANSFALAVMLPTTWLTCVPLYALLFCLGRMLFWLGYRVHSLYRAPGFAMTALPTVAATLFNLWTLFRGSL